jgi:hypothetical protein
MDFSSNGFALLLQALFDRQLAMNDPDHKLTLQFTNLLHLIQDFTPFSPALGLRKVYPHPV